MNKRLLFVDDDVNILSGLRRSMRSLHDEWQMAFAESAAAALQLCAAAPFDMVISDARMPGMEGSSFLAEVRRLYPDTVRFILSGQCSRDSVLRCVGVAHQFLSKPCDAVTLKTAIQRIGKLRDSFQEGTTRRTIAGAECLPSRPSVCTELVAEVNSEKPSIERVAAIIAQDVAMSAKAVQLVSSGFFGTPQRVGGVAQAVTLLGLETLKFLRDTPATFRPCSTADEVDHLERLTEHSLAVAAVAKRIAATMTEDRVQIGDSYMAGLLHEIGTLALGRSIEMQAAEEDPDPAGYLAALWGLPDAVVQAIAYHRMPDACLQEAPIPLAALHVAHTLVASPGQTEIEIEGVLQ